MIDWEGRRIEPCACGGYLVAAIRAEAIMRAVSKHQRTAIHLDWSARQGYPQPTKLVDYSLDLRDPIH
jgi:hypothetical protein